MDYLNHLFFSLKGRLPRSGFWVGSIAILVMETLLALYLAQMFEIPIMDMGKPGLTDEQFIAIYDKVATLGLLVNVIFLWPWIAVIGKRAHDRNKSAWWVLLTYVPIVGNIWSLVELGLVRGTSGVNRFGNDPFTKP
ncbi:DUF805 domain-containing protein [Aestuariivirga litoralis]|uniref:DUF805 domain-containing protein n=1 Tax=Aestuariivirga litoralis TaxID=2650924 RepID=UPI0018C6B3F9|nr:DUF805 domain-containing protein [Aestuariivirga litoralis]MBG1232761.1 DUF805 domain-containing protein [Aestuariivirga litoralis]